MPPAAAFLASALLLLTLGLIWHRYGEMLRVEKEPASAEPLGRAAGITAAADKANHELLILDYRPAADPAVSENGDVERALRRRLKASKDLRILYATAVDEPSWLGDRLGETDRALFGPGTLAPTRNMLAAVADRRYIYAVNRFGRASVTDLSKVVNPDVRGIFTRHYLQDADTAEGIIAAVSQDALYRRPAPGAPAPAGGGPRQA